MSCSGYEKNPANPEPAIVEVTVRARGSVIRVAEHGVDMYSAIDLAADKVTRQLRKFKTKVIDNRQQGPSAAEVAPEARVEDLADLLIPADQDDQLVREKIIEITPMTEEQALVQTDLIGHDFYVFENAATGHALSQSITAKTVDMASSSPRLRSLRRKSE